MYQARCLFVEMLEDKEWGVTMQLLMKSSKSQEALTVIQTNTPQFPTNPLKLAQQSSCFVLAMPLFQTMRCVSTNLFFQLLPAAEPFLPP